MDQAPEQQHWDLGIMNQDETPVYIKAIISFLCQARRALFAMLCRQATGEAHQMNTTEIGGVCVDSHQEIAIANAYPKSKISSAHS